MYEYHILSRSGRKKSEAFSGVEIAKASNRDKTEPLKYEWNEARVFEIDPVWARAQEKEEYEKTGREITIAPYTVGIKGGTISKGRSNYYDTIDANSISQILDIVRNNLPMLYRDIEEQLKQYTPSEALDYEPSRRRVEP